VQKQTHNRTYYVVVHGRKPGIYKNSKQALAQVHQFPYGKMKKIRGLKEAKAYFAQYRQTNAKHKVYYVVKRGHNPGLYLDKGKALQQIKNYPNGKMKRVKGYENARAYLQGKTIKKKEKPPLIFIDGSYMQNGAFASYGFVVMESERIIAKDSGIIFDFDVIHLHSLGAEMFALIRAVEWAIANEYKKVHVVYDSEAVIQRLENDEKVNGKQEKGIQKLVQTYEQYKKYIEINYSHKRTNKVYESRHKVAHDLSRLMSNIIDYD